MNRLIELCSQQASWSSNSCSRPEVAVGTGGSTMTWICRFGGADP